ncbi:NAD(P)-dependent dehydrogenase (short-subunit alcohol dehydrogenase family) [Kibdelosporangium banguiense]|uniref:NAD(P)-dependent dehydrogenase (Short-subunit alcohol dehydrogenase family) n=1 Tax=Kibdelosporangium banguiense TaxID=1365924 RepID=A0ABS4TJD5_9PSEU|nr:short-chain dehydrogenase/reductase [Kibdelosporangium banguiense]MBP2324434.1 NAD(P)-dependent dehydrogenase (short-subunit alcohol dehydrogenase family) [Kibdelosporangium banguiense]
MTGMATRITSTLRDLGLPLPGGQTYRVAGRTVLITGGGAGIGRALAHALHQRGAIVALVDRDEAALAETAKELGDERVFTVVADVRDRTGIADAVGESAERAGGLDVVVANAGVTPSPATLRQVDPAEFDRVMAINLTGAFNTVRPAVDALVTRRGHVVVVSSVAAFVPGPGGAAYMISKAAVEQLGRALRLELAAHGVSVGVAYFGVVDTQLARTTLDDDLLGRELERRLPPPLRRRITANQAATVLADAIARRAGRTLAPAVWQPWALLRGLVNVAADAYLADDRNLHRLIHDLETRYTGGSR